MGIFDGFDIKKIVMGFSNDPNIDDKLNNAVRLHRSGVSTGWFICPECGGYMNYEDSVEDVLVCEDCGYDMPTERYGFEDPDVWDVYNCVPTYEELLEAESKLNGTYEDPDDYDEYSD